MSCPVCNAPDYIRCGCDNEPYCDPCTTSSVCVEKIDAECVLYHRDNLSATKLTCMGLPNRTTLEQFMEAVDTYICQINATQIPITPIDTESVNLTAFSTLKHTIQADVNISAASGNTIEIRTDGLFAGSGTTYTADQGIELAPDPDGHNFRLVEVLDGAGTKFLWNYTKAAFRAGQSTTTFSDNASIGQYSAAFGFDTLASGIGAFAGGNSNGVTGNYGIAYGQAHTVSAINGSAFGNHNVITSNAIASFAGGKDLISQQPYAAVFGRANSANGTTSLGISQGGSFLAGLGNHTGGEASFVIGESNFVNADFSGALGLQNELSGNYTYAFGRRLINAVSSNVVIIGLYNASGDTAADTVEALTPDSTSATPALIVGRGYATGVPPTEVEHGYNGLIIYKSGTARFYGAIDQRDSARGFIPARWLNGGRPTSPIKGETGYNLTADKMEYWNGTSWIQYP